MDNTEGTENTTVDTERLLQRAQLKNQVFLQKLAQGEDALAEARADLAIAQHEMQNLAKQLGIAYDRINELEGAFNAESEEETTDDTPDKD